jgi:hypothetical protein
LLATPHERIEHRNFVALHGRRLRVSSGIGHRRTAVAPAAFAGPPPCFDW